MHSFIHFIHSNLSEFIRTIRITIKPTDITFLPGLVSAIGTR